MMIDLHLHSNFSDGLDTPKELIDKALASGYNLRAIALTDHDTIEGLEDEAFRAYKGFEKGRSYRNWFKKGCCDRIVSRMKEENLSIIENHYVQCEEKGIVRYDPYKETTEKIKAHQKAKGIKLRTLTPSKSQYSRVGYGSGYKAGGRVGLNTNPALPGRK